MRKYPSILFLLAWLAILVIAFISSCKTKPPASSQEKTTTIIRDTTVTPPSLVIRDTVRFQIDCDEKGVGTIRPVISSKGESYGGLTLTGSGNQLLIESRYAPAPITLKGISTTEQSEKVVVAACDPVMFVPGIYKFQFWVAALVELLIVAYIAYRVAKPG